MFQCQSSGFHLGTRLEGPYVKKGPERHAELHKTKANSVFYQKGEQIRGKLMEKGPVSDLGSTGKRQSLIVIA